MNTPPEKINRTEEINRVNTLTQKAWTALQENPSQAESIIQNLHNDVFDDVHIKTHLHNTDNISLEENYIIALNHPTVLPEHKILFNNTHSLPYYIPFLDQTMQKLTGKKVHFILTDPLDPHYQSIIKNLEHIMIPPKNSNRNKRNQDRKKMNSEIKQYLDRGDHVALFPEGNWFGTGKVGPFQKGISHILKNNASHDLLPIRIDGFDDAYTNIDVHFGTPQRPSTQNKSAAEIADDIRKKIFHKKLGFSLAESR